MNRHSPTRRHRTGLGIGCFIGLGASAACNEAFIPPGGLDDVALEDTSVTPDVADTVLVIPEGACPVTVRAGFPAASRVAVAGAWNGFSTDAEPMRREGEGWVAELALPPGEYPFKFAVNGEIEATLPSEVPTHWYQGLENRNLIVGDCARPSLTVEELVVGPLEGGEARVRATVCATPARDGAPLDAATFEVEVGTGEVAATPVAGRQDCVFVETARGPGKHSLHAAVKDRDGREAAPLWVPLWVERDRFDWRDAMLYMAMVDRFRDSDGAVDAVAQVPRISNYQGGDFEGLVDAIDEGYFSDLGVDALWLTPVVDNTDAGLLGRFDPNLYAGYHGYWPVSASAIEPRLTAGDDADAAFSAFVKKAHEAGMRVVIDVVLNHVHEDHAWCAETPAMCKRTCVCGTDSCDWEAQALGCQFASYLPDLDYRDHTTVTKVVDSVIDFARRFDIDGFRLDAVKHVDHVVLKALRARVAEIEARGGARFWLVGEVFTGAEGRPLIASYLNPGELDGQFDFPLYWSIRNTFVNDGSMRDLEAALVASEAAYGESLPFMSPFLGNHDVERIATALAKNDLGPWGGTVDLLETAGDVPTRWDIINPLSLAMAFTLTLRGVPLLYMGDEVGLGGSNDPDNRRMLPRVLSADQREVLRRVQELGRARRDYPVIRRGQRRELWLNEDIYVQARWLPDGERRLVVIAMNKGDAQTLDVTLPSELGVSGGSLRSLFSGERIAVAGQGFSLSLEPWEYGLFVYEP